MLPVHEPCKIECIIWFREQQCYMHRSRQEVSYPSSADPAEYALHASRKAYGQIILSNRWFDDGMRWWCSGWFLKVGDTVLQITEMLYLDRLHVFKKICDAKRFCGERTMRFFRYLPCSSPLSPHTGKGCRREHQPSV